MPGFGHLDIGANRGNAVPFDPSPIIGQYVDMLNQRKAKHEAEVKQLGDELAKGYDPSTLRNDADKTEYIKRYGYIKQAAIDAENEKDNTKKALALGAVRKQLSDLGAFAAGSKQQGAFERQMGLAHLKDRYLLDDNSVQKLTSQRDKIWNDPSVIRDASGFERGVDPNKMETEYQKTNDEILKHHPATYGPESIRYGQDVFGRKTATGTSSRVVPFQDAFEIHLHRATADPNYQKYLNDKYPTLQDANPQKQLALRVQQDMKDHHDDQGVFDKPKTKQYEDIAPDRFYEHYNYELAHPKPTAAQREAGTPTYIQDLSQRSRNPETQATAFDELSKIVSSNPAYNKGIKVVHNPDGTLKSLIVPAKYKFEAGKATGEKNSGRVVVKDAYEVPLDPNKPELYDAAFGNIYKDVTGSGTGEASKMLTPGGKGHVTGAGPKQPHQIKSNDEYNKLPKGTHFIWTDGQEYIKP